MVPWKKHFIRVKYKDKEAKGAIFISDEESVNKLIKSLNKAKPQLKEYEKMKQQIDANGV